MRKSRYNGGFCHLICEDEGQLRTIRENIVGQAARPFCEFCRGVRREPPGVRQFMVWGQQVWLHLQCRAGYEKANVPAGVLTGVLIEEELHEQTGA